MDTSYLVQFMGDRNYNLDEIITVLEEYSSTNNVPYVDECLMLLENYYDEELSNSIISMIREHIPYGNLNEHSTIDEYLETCILIYVLIKKGIELNDCC